MKSRWYDLACTAIRAVVIAALLGVGGCSEENEFQVIADPLLGCWEALFSIQAGDTSFVSNIGLLWIFSADRTLCALDAYPDSTYGPDIHVRYLRGEGSVDLLIVGEEPWHLSCSFGAANDTLYLYGNDERFEGEGWLVFKRSAVVPENDYCTYVHN